MEAAGTSRWANGARGLPSARLVRAAAALGILLLTLAGAVLVGRRISGALAVPLSTAGLAAVGVLLSAAGLGFRRLLRELPLPPQSRFAFAALPSVVALLWLAALSLPQTSAGGLFLLWSPVLLAEGWSWGRLAAGVRELPGLPASAAAASEVAPTLTLAREDKPLADLEPAGRDDALLGEQMRRRDQEAGEVLEGWVRVDFVPGQRHAVAHLAICPPFAQNPTCYAEAVDGPDASVKVTQAMSYGVRLEVKLAEPAEDAARVVVEYSILESAAAGE